MIRRSGSTSVSPLLDIYSVTTAMINSNKLSILIRIEGTEERNIETLWLIDSGAGGKFINQNYDKKNGIQDSQIGETLTSLQHGWN